MAVFSADAFKNTVGAFFSAIRYDACSFPVAGTLILRHHCTNGSGPHHNQNKTCMRKLLFAAMAFIAVSFIGCVKESESFEGIGTPRTAVPDELVGRWAIVGISGSTVYNIPAGTTFNTNEYFLGYQINKDGTIKEDGYLATYQYGVSTWAKWTAYGSVALNNGAIEFHRARGSYTSSRNS